MYCYKWSWLTVAERSIAVVNNLTVTMVEDFTELHHLHEPESDDSGLRVVSVPQTVGKPGTYRYNVLTNTDTQACNCGSVTNFYFLYIKKMNLSKLVHRHLKKPFWYLPLYSVDKQPETTKHIKKLIIFDTDQKITRWTWIFLFWL